MADTPELKALREEHGIPEMTNEDWQNIQWSRVGIMKRVLAEVIKRMPEQDKNDILAMIEDHARAADQKNGTPFASMERGYEEMMYAETVAAQELADMIKTPYHHMMETPARKS
ncbi:hypothetical protein [Acetobacter cerevisiae]|uniref:hypothetical protein n=1 Tax=Acetobacter cerevisiae TaxID=178900 RepID=UPI00209E3B28|nr:hypothetical protein [Acetobacter cerevisiae]MCP1271234.1 hypothetical protein [Acetobacter cerevisiae]MCP1279188.1 hypothetical protein [Acetobacter cerevisiae]